MDTLIHPLDLADKEPVTKDELIDFCVTYLNVDFVTDKSGATTFVGRSEWLQKYISINSRNSKF